MPRRFFQKRPVKLALFAFILTLNILFYTLGYPDTGANTLYKESILLLVFIQIVFLYGLSGTLYFFIKDV